MAQLFISHAEEDKDVALELGRAFRAEGFSTWYYEDDSLPGLSYLDQVYKAIKGSEALVLLVSLHSLRSRQVDGEVIVGYETGKHFVPVLNGVSHDQLQERDGWRIALGAATSIPIPVAGVSGIIGQLTSGIKQLGIHPGPKQISSNDSPTAVAPTTDSVGDPAECTIFAPSEVQPGETAMVHVWLHTPNQTANVQRISEEFDQPAANRRTNQIMQVSLAREVPLHISLQVGSLPVRSALTELSWSGGPHVKVFRVDAPPEGQPATEVDQATVYLSSLLVANLRFKMEIAGTDPLGKQLGESAQLQKVYLSYAHQDRAEVLRRAQMLSMIGVRYDMDATSLRPGTEWNAQIRHLIDEADALFLFWSESARRSKWVEQEWKYALSTKKRIVPIALETPLPPAPPELAVLHFQPSFAYFLGAAEKE